MQSGQAACNRCGNFLSDLLLKNPLPLMLYAFVYKRGKDGRGYLLLVLNSWFPKAGVSALPSYD